MKLRVAAALLVLLIGSLGWLAGIRHPKANSPSSNDLPNLSKATVGPTPESSNSARAEGNPDVPRDAVDAPTNGVDAGPVLPKPAAILLAAREELPATPGPIEEGSVNLPPATALENLRAMFRQYSQRFGGNPVGNNSEITAALNGQNARQIVFIQADDGAHINQRGELVDGWNSPYFFHQLSGTEMEIRSAGADRRMWTADDLVVR